VEVNGWSYVQVNVAWLLFDQLFFETSAFGPRVIPRGNVWDTCKTSHTSVRGLVFAVSTKLSVGGLVDSNAEMFGYDGVD